MPLHCALEDKDALLKRPAPYREKEGWHGPCDGKGSLSSDAACRGAGGKMENRNLPAMHSSPSQIASTASLLEATIIFLAADGEHDKHACRGAKLILSTNPRYGAEVKRKQTH